MTKALLCLLVLSCGALAGPLDPAKAFIQGFYTAYSGQEFTAANCLSDSLQTDLVITLEALVLDFEDEHSFALFFAHANELYKDLLTVQSACGLTALNQHLASTVAQEGWSAFVGVILKEETILEGFALQLMQQLLQHEWEAAGTTAGEAVAAVIPPEINTLSAPIPDANYFQKFDNFTAGLFYGFVPNPNPKKPATCITTYNSTSSFFYQASSTIKGCVHLFIADCQAVRDLVPAAIINIQGLVLACKLPDLLQTFKNLADPTYWSQVAVAYYFNTQTINAKIADMKQCLMLQNWYGIGVDAGTIIRLIFNFKLT